LLLISLELCSEFEVILKHYSKRVELHVKILELVVPISLSTVIYEVTNFHKITCKFSESWKFNNSWTGQWIRFLIR
jgi:hypothetical protein